MLQELFKADVISLNDKVSSLQVVPPLLYSTHYSNEFSLVCKKSLVSWPQCLASESHWSTPLLQDNFYPITRIITLQLEWL